MRILTVLALAALGASVYHYRQARRPRRARAAPELIPDDLLAERVRAGIAGAVTKAIDVRVIHGIVTLRGTVKRAERDLALAAALAVPGVGQVANQLEIEDAAPEAST
jgi:osmotically-inducible protein OsmY